MLENKDVYETEHIKMWISDGVFHSSYPPDLVVTLEIAKQIVLDRIAYTEGIEYPVLVDIRNIKKVAFAASKYWASKESYQSISRLAVFSDKPLSRIIFNFYLVVDKPFRSTKYFTNKGSAYLFLKGISAN